MKRVIQVFAGMVFGLLLGAATAVALPYSFTNITGNTLVDAAIGEAQALMEVTADSGDVLFTFYNLGPLASSITDVYFDDADGSLLGGLAAILNGTGVSFSEGASPANLPGGNTVGFDADFSADSNAPTQPNGVNPGEQVGLRFTLLDGGLFDDVIAALSEGDLRVGLHVQGFEDGGSESFVNSTTPVPEPATLLLLGGGLAALGMSRRRRN